MCVAKPGLMAGCELAAGRKGGESGYPVVSASVLRQRQPLPSRGLVRVPVIGPAKHLESMDMISPPSAGGKPTSSRQRPRRCWTAASYRAAKPHSSENSTGSSVHMWSGSG